MLLHISVIGTTSDWDIFMSFPDKVGKLMEFFNSTVGIPQTLVVALDAGLSIWGAINLLEGYSSNGTASRCDCQISRQTARAMNGSLRPGCGNPGEMTARGLTILFHGLPKTEGEPCSARVKRRLRSYDSPQGRPVISLSSGARGKVTNKKILQQLIQPHRNFLLCYSSSNSLGAAVFMECKT